MHFCRGNKSIPLNTFIYDIILWIANLLISTWVWHLWKEIVFTCVLTWWYFRRVVLSILLHTFSTFRRKKYLWKRDRLADSPGGKRGMIVFPHLLGFCAIAYEVIAVKLPYAWYISKWKNEFIWIFKGKVLIGIDYFLSIVSGDVNLKGTFKGKTDQQFLLIGKPHNQAKFFKISM